MARADYLRAHGVQVIEVKVGAKDMTTAQHVWRDSNFWNVFDESRYDIIQTGRAGQSEFPFCAIKKTPIVDSLHLVAGVDNQYNIARVMHISQWSARQWVRMGGDASRVVLISHPLELMPEPVSSLRAELQIAPDVFVYGFHQRADDDIFSPIPLEAYAQIEQDTTLFIVLGGGSRYRVQAEKLGIKKIIFLDHTNDQMRVACFLKTLNVYAHGRKDGEVNSTAMGEALGYGLPIISHTSPVNNGQAEAIAHAGVVVSTVGEYVDELRRLGSDTVYYAYRSRAARQRFLEHYELSGQINHIAEIYRDVIKNPFPRPVLRRLRSLQLWYYGIYSWIRMFNYLRRRLGLVRL
jgi:glycosyltransferase involved in cell wall biosynthesis